MDGWIKLHRKILESDLWQTKESFSVRDAWIDLLLLVNHADKKILFDGDPYIVQRGQHVTSIRKLSDRWGWGIKKTRKYLEILEREQMLTKKSTNRHTCLTILNYAKYQGLEDIEGTQEDTQEDTQREQQRAHRGDNTTPPNKNDKNDKNEKKSIYGDYGHVRLKESELEKLKKDYGEDMTNKTITFLDEYIEMKGYKAKSHYLCIKKWVVDAVKKDQNKKGFASGKGSESLDDFIKMMEG